MFVLKDSFLLILSLGVLSLSLSLTGYVAALSCRRLNIHSKSNRITEIFPNQFFDVCGCLAVSLFNDVMYVFGIKRQEIER